MFEKAPVQTVVKPEDNVDVFAPCEKGGRNMALTKLAGSLLPKLPFSAVLATCRLWNQQNTLPLPDDELLRTVESVAALEARKSCEALPPWPQLDKAALHGLAGDIETSSSGCRRSWSA